jgi:hypothetical protein
MNCLLRPWIWPSFSPSCRLYEPEAGRPPVLAPGTYRSGTPRNQSRGIAERLPGTRRKRLRCAWHTHLRGLATSIHETSGLIELSKSFRDNYARVMAVPHSGQRTWGQGTPRSWGILLPHLEQRHSPLGPRRKPPMPPPPAPRPPPPALPPDLPPPRLCIFDLQYLRARLPQRPFPARFRLEPYVDSIHTASFRILFRYSA